MFKPIANPYIVGNPIKTQDMFYGREDDFEFIRRKLESGGKSYIIVLCGERRSGKTSILFQILSGRLGDNFVPILIDMQTMAGLKNELEFFEKFAQETARCLTSDSGVKSDIFSTTEDSSYKTFSNFLDNIHDAYPGKHILFLIDEYEIIEAKIEEGSLSENFIPYLSGILESEKLVSFIFTGSSKLEERKDAIWHVLFGKSLFRNVSFLTRPDTLRLITEPVEGQITYDTEVLNTIYRLTSGQPFYTQVVCQNIVDYVNQNRKTHIQLEDMEVIVNEILDNPLPQMIYFWNSLSDDRKLVLSLLADILEKPDTFITAEEVIKESKRRKFGLDLTLKMVKTTLETLYHNKHVSKGQSGYNFQMDLFRRWIKRDHAIWRVMKEVSNLGQAASVVSQVYEPTTEPAEVGGKKKMIWLALPLLILISAAIWWFSTSNEEGSPASAEMSAESDAGELAEPPVEAGQNKESSKPVAQENQQEQQEEEEPKQLAQQVQREQATEAKETRTPPVTRRPAVQQRAEDSGVNIALQKASAAQEKARQARTTAESSNAQQNAEALFARARQKEQTAAAHMQAKRYNNAASDFNEAATLYAQAASAAAEQGTALENEAARLKQQLASAKSAANANYEILPAYKRALREESQGDSYNENDNTGRAVESYRAALNSHNEAKARHDAIQSAIQATVNGYLDAIEAEDVEGMKRNHKNFDAGLESDWQALFDYANNIKVLRTIQSVTLLEDKALATVNIDLFYEGADRDKSKNTWKMELVEQGSRWFISSISEGR